MNSSIRRIITTLVIVSCIALGFLGGSAIFSNYFLNKNQKELLHVVEIEK